MWPYIALATVALAIAGLWRSGRRMKATNANHAAEIDRLRQNQKELAEKFQAQQKALLNSMVEGLLVLDENNRIQATNRALKGFFNLNGPVAGQTVLEAFRLHPLEELAQRLKTENQVLDFELELPGFKARWLQVNAAAILDEHSQRLGSVLVFHDLTRLRQLENTRQEFVANVSHELRTPLAMIKGYAETLLGGARNDPEVSVRFLEKIEKHSDRLASLIEDLLTISQLEGGFLELNFQPTRLGPLVEQVFEDLRSRADERRVTLENRVADHINAAVDGDRLKQVLWNLVENAIKYGREEGAVVVSANTIAGTVEIAVRDNGPGIAPEALPRVFERFYRADKARSRETGGTGLGLSIVKHIIQSHGGKVWVESQLEQGSTFYFTLPKAPPEAH